MIDVLLLFKKNCMFILLDGSYSEHGREIFDEEVADEPKATTASRSKKVLISLLLSLCLVPVSLLQSLSFSAHPSMQPFLSDLLSTCVVSYLPPSIGCKGCGQTFCQRQALVDERQWGWRQEEEGGNHMTCCTCDVHV